MMLAADPANLESLPHWMQAGLAWLSHQQFVITLLILMTLDILTGTLLALAKKTLSSSMSFRGMAKKAAVLIILGVCGTLQPFANGIPLLAPCAAWFIVSEAISIIEHCGALGVPLPPFLLDSLAKIREQKAIKNMAIAPEGSVIVNPTSTQPLKIAAVVVEPAAKP